MSFRSIAWTISKNEPALLLALAKRFYIEIISFPHFFLIALHHHQVEVILMFIFNGMRSKETKKKTGGLENC